MFNLNRKRYEPAEPLFREALAMYRELPDETFYTINCLRGLGRLLRETGRWTEADAVLREALALYPENFAHDGLAGIHWQLACVARRLGADDEAALHERLWLAIGCETLARRHPAHAPRLRQYAWAIRDPARPGPSLELDALLAELDDPAAERRRALLRGSGLLDVDS